MKRNNSPSDWLLFYCITKPKVNASSILRSADILEQYINVICVILFCQCDFTQLWGNQPTKIGRKALCIRIEINKFQSNTYSESNFKF